MSRMTMIAVATMILSVSSRYVEAQEERDTVIVVTATADIMRGRDVVAIVPEGNIYIVTQVNGGWLGVEHNGKTGWIRTKDVRLGTGDADFKRRQDLHLKYKAQLVQHFKAGRIQEAIAAAEASFIIFGNLLEQREILFPNDEALKTARENVHENENVRFLNQEYGKLGQTQKQIAMARELVRSRTIRLGPDHEQVKAARAALERLEGLNK